MLLIAVRPPPTSNWLSLSPSCMLLHSSYSCSFISLIHALARLLSLSLHPLDFFFSFFLLFSFFLVDSPCSCSPVMTENAAGQKRRVSAAFDWLLYSGSWCCCYALIYTTSSLSLVTQSLLLYDSEREREDDPFSSGSHEIHLFDMCTERERERGRTNI